MTAEYPCRRLDDRPLGRWAVRLQRIPWGPLTGVLVAFALLLLVSVVRQGMVQAERQARINADQNRQAIAAAQAAQAQSRFNADLIDRLDQSGVVTAGLAEDAVRSLVTEMRAADARQRARLDELLELLTAEVRDPQNQESRAVPTLRPEPSPTPGPTPTAGPSGSPRASPAPSAQPTATPPGPVPLVCLPPLARCFPGD